MNKEQIYEQLLQAGRADVTDQTMSSVLEIANTLWNAEPKIEFENGRAFMRPPALRLSRAKKAVDARQAQLEVEDSETPETSEKG